MEITAQGIKKSDVFVVFDKVIKDPDFFIIKHVMKNYDKYIPYLHLEQFVGYPDEIIYRMVISRTEKDLFKWLMKKEFNYQESYNYIYNKYKNMYNICTLLNIGKSIYNLSSSYLIDNIYVWNEKYDKRQSLELASLYVSDTPKNIVYCEGPYFEVLNNLPNVHTIFDWDVDRVTEVIESRADIIFGIPRYGFNYEYREDDSLILKNELDKYKNVGTYDIQELKIPSYYG